MKHLPSYLVSGLVLLAIAINIDLPFGLANSTGNNAAHANDQVSFGLHRLNFRLEGKSCAACLLSIQRKINSLPGVKEAVVMLKRPYGVSVIYQISQIKSDEILAIIKEKEPNIKILEINDTNTSGIPSPLIPPFVPIFETSQ